MIDAQKRYISNNIFKGHGICTWYEYVGKPSSKIHENPVIRKMPEAKPKGIMTEGATKRLRKYLDLWFNAIHTYYQKYNAPAFKHKHFLTFITLTLPSSQNHTDEFIKRWIFWPWLEIIKRYYGVQEYIWRAEKQQNGNIHFHVLIDKYIRHDLVRYHWNYHLDKYGYISAYSDIRKKLAPMELVLLNAFKPELEPVQCQKRIDAVLASFFTTGKFDTTFLPALKQFCHYLKTRPAGATFQIVRNRLESDIATGFRNPNSTDIHAPNKIKNLVSYVIKYMSKKEKAGTKEIAVAGRCWGRSNGLEKLEYFTTCECSETETLLQNKLLVTVSKIFDGHYFSFLKFNLYKYLKQFSAKLFGKLTDHFLALYDLIYPEKQLLFNFNSNAP